MQNRLSLLGVFLVVSLLSLSLLFPTLAKADGNKCGVNVGPYYEQVDSVKGLTKEGGWIVALGSLGQCADYSSLFGKGLNVVIRAYNGGQKFDNSQADAWVATLHDLDTKGQPVYFMPWNEPNHENEGGGGDAGPETFAYISYLKSQITAAGIDNKVRLLSPMVNKTNPNFDTFFSNPGGKEAYYKVGEGSSINEYDFPATFPTSSYPQACQHADSRLNNCKYSPDLGIPGPFYSLEAGVAGTDPSYPAYRDPEIKTMLSGSWGTWSGDASFNMFAVFSYDPHRPGSWDIFQAPQTKSFYNSSCTTGTVEGNDNVIEDQYDTWFGNKQTGLVACASGCGYAPVNRPELCDAAGRNELGYDLSIYDDYNANPDDFYLQPIKGLEASYADRDVTTIRNDLIAQGYEASCATPQFKIKLNQDGVMWMHDYLDPVNFEPKNENDFNGTVFGGDIIYQNSTNRGHEDIPYRSTLTVDYRDTLVPVFRDVTGKRWLTSSLEEYFGFADTKVQDSSRAEINSAPINSLLDRRQRCIQTITSLTQQEIMCNKLANPDSCALYSRPIPETALTIKSLLDLYKANFLLKLPGETYNTKDGIANYCQLFAANYKNGGFLNAEYAGGIFNTPLTIDRAYRLAFLVTDIQLLPPSASKMFNLFDHPNGGFLSGSPTQPLDNVLINAFKVPDFTTNKGAPNMDPSAPATTGNVPWSDSALLTRNSLLTTQEQKNTEELAAAKRQSLTQEAAKYDASSQTQSDEIYCHYGAKNTGLWAPTCRDALSKSVVDIVNAQSKLSQYAVGTSPLSEQLREEGFDQFQTECTDLQKEYSGKIADPGTLQPVTAASKVYNVAFGAELLDRLFNDSIHELGAAGSERDPSFAETWRDRDPQGTKDNLYGPEDDTIREGGSNPWGGLEDWGLKSTFHVVQETKATGFNNDCCQDARKVKHFLVYPEGYDLQTVQSVLAGSFFTSEQLISLAETADEFDRFQVTGDQVSFEGATKTKEFDDFVGTPPNWNPSSDISSCTEICVAWDRPPGVPGAQCIRHTYTLPCRRSFGWAVIKDGDTLSAGILGAKLGFWVREVQKSLNSKVSDARTYLDLCQTTEQFLTGECGEDVTIIPTPTPDACTALSCGGVAPPGGGTVPPASGTCVEIRVRDGKVYAYNKCDCSLGDWQLQDADGGLWCGPLGGNNTLFPHEEKGPFCDDRPLPATICAAADAPGSPPGPPLTCISQPERVCITP